MMRRSWALAGVLALVGAGATAAWLAPPRTGAVASDHYDGRRFHYAPAGVELTLGDHLAWLSAMRRVPWPTWVRDPAQLPPPARVSAGRLRVTFINHATTLIQLDSLNILTDPVWSAHAGPFGRFGAARVRAPGVKLSDLPPIDYVLISHDHYDHLDVPTVRELEHRFHPRFVVGLGVGRELPIPAERVTELDWWATRTGPGIRVTFVPARHQSGRLPLRANSTLWGGFVLESRAGPVYYAGDTGAGDFVDSIAQRYPRIRLANLPVGGSAPYWFMASMHMSAEDAVAACVRLGARQGLAVHFATFAEHTEEPIGQPARDLQGALRRRGLDSARFWTLGFGEGRDVPPLGEAAP